MSPMVQEILYWILVALLALVFARLLCQMRQGRKPLCEKVDKIIRILVNKFSLTKMEPSQIEFPKLGKPVQKTRAPHSTHREQA